MIDTNSGTWQYIRQYLDAQLVEAQKFLERSGVNRAETEHLRGKIAAIKGLMDLPLSVDRQRPQDENINDLY